MGNDKQMSRGKISAEQLRRISVFEAWSRTDTYDFCRIGDNDPTMGGYDVRQFKLGGDGNFIALLFEQTPISREMFPQK